MPTLSQAPATTKKSNFANELLTEKFIEAIEKGVSPLQKLWVSSVYGLPRGYEGHVYRGANMFLALFAMMENSWKVPVFVTYKKAKAEGIQVKKGSKGIKVLFSSLTVPKEFAKTPELCPRELKRFYTKVYTVFNVEQCEGVDLEKFATSSKVDAMENEFSVIDEAEKVVKGYNSAPTLNLENPTETSAYYQVKQDVVCMPPKQTFVSEEAYYSVLFHELSHSTGNEKRLNRELKNQFGSTEYAFEELVAELSSSFLSMQVGIQDKCFEASASYLDNWLTHFKSDTNFLRKAMTEAQRAVDHINGTKF